MSRTLCIANQRAGVGKTTTSVNLATGLARAGLRTLIVDLDPRASATQHLGPDAANDRVNDPHETIATYVQGCDLLAPIDHDHTGWRNRLDELLHELDQKSAYEVILLDCPPTANAQTSWALAIAEELLMPVCCDDFGMDGVEDFVVALRAAIGQGSRIDFSGVLLTRCNGSARAVEIEREARDFFGDVVLQTVIPADPVIEDARRSRRAVMDVALRSRAARAYLELCREVLER